MKVLVIPDIHLKPFMFEQAALLMKNKAADRAVCLMDIPDDWDKQWDIVLYEQTYDAAIQFAKTFPDTLWCYGNHDLSYWWHQFESGYSSMPICECTNPGSCFRLLVIRQWKRLRERATSFPVTFFPLIGMVSQSVHRNFCCWIQ